MFRRRIHPSPRVHPAVMGTRRRTMFEPFAHLFLACVGCTSVTRFEDGVPPGSIGHTSSNTRLNERVSLRPQKILVSGRWRRTRAVISATCSSGIRQPR